jgi:hypothetical protein
VAVKAIETRAYGCRFRSRTEARWATLFNHMKWGWEYEPQGFKLPSGNYLPDFRLRIQTSHEPFWFEVKPGNNKRDDPRWPELAVASDMVMVVARGMHRTGDNCATAHGALAYSPSGATALMDLLWQRTVPADVWDTASSARFEFGEIG